MNKTTRKYNLGNRFIPKGWNYTVELPEGLFKVLLHESNLLPGTWDVSVVRLPYEWEKKQVPEETCVLPMAPRREAEKKYWQESLVLSIAKDLNDFFEREYSEKEQKQAIRNLLNNLRHYIDGDGPESYCKESSLERAIRTLALSEDATLVNKANKYLASFFSKLYRKKGKNGEASMLMGSSDESPDRYIKEVIGYLVEGHRISQYEREESLRDLDV